MQVSSPRIQRSLSRGPHSLDSAIRTLWFLNSQSLASQLTPTINSSLSLSVPLSFVLAHHARVPQPLWPGSRRPFPRNCSIEGPTIRWVCRHLGFLATLFTVRPISLRPLVHDTTVLWKIWIGVKVHGRSCRCLYRKCVHILLNTSFRVLLESWKGEWIQVWSVRFPCRGTLSNFRRSAKENDAVWEKFWRRARFRDAALSGRAFFRWESGSYDARVPQIS